MYFSPYQIKNKKVFYSGNKIFKPIAEIRGIKPPDLSKRHLELKKDSKKWEAIIKIWNGIFKASGDFMETNGAVLFDLPITTRMISSPGALTGTIPSDVNPFKIKFFNKTTFLTQSSQLYLEFAITNPKINKVFCWEKSFRRERVDFRHLPEFTHIEFEGNINFEENLKFQERYLKYVINYLIKNFKKEISIFLDSADIQKLKLFTKLKNFKRITFIDAFKLLKIHTGNAKYSRASVKTFGAYEEVLLTELLGGPVFITHYIGNEVAFYHATDPKNHDLVINADLLFPGFGELIGSGERIHQQKELIKKAKHFKLNAEDYESYIESRLGKPKIHSGWGMGIERFIQIILKLPFIWETKPFPRIDGQNRP